MEILWRLCPLSTNVYLFGVGFVLFHVRVLSVFFLFIPFVYLYVLLIANVLYVSFHGLIFKYN